MNSWLRPFSWLWVSPNSLLGIALLLPDALGRGRVRLVDGVLEAHGPFLRFLLRRAWPIGGASAMTLGHVVIARDQAALDATRIHERVHVAQYELWGPLFIPAYLVASVLALARGGDVYRDNAFEAEAFAVESRSDEVAIRD